MRAARHRRHYRLGKSAIARARWPAAAAPRVRHHLGRKNCRPVTRRCALHRPRAAAAAAGCRQGRPPKQLCRLSACWAARRPSRALAAVAGRRCHAGCRRGQGSSRAFALREPFRRRVPAAPANREERVARKQHCEQVQTKRSVRKKARAPPFVVTADACAHPQHASFRVGLQRFAAARRDGLTVPLFSASVLWQPGTHSRV